MSYCTFKVVGQKQTLKQRIDNASQEIKVWWDENKEWAIVVLPVGLALGSWIIRKIVTGSFSIAKGFVTSGNLRKEKMLKELYCYDRSLGHYWKLSRPLTSAEWIAVDRRKKAGETLANILMSMHVI